MSEECKCGGSCGTQTTELSFVEMLEAWKSALVGTVEFRAWMARKDENFRVVQDPDIDDDVRAAAKASKESGAGT